MDRDQHRLLFYFILAVVAALAIAGGCYVAGVGIAHGQDVPRAAACFALAALAVIVADLFRPRAAAYR